MTTPNSEYNVLYEGLVGLRPEAIRVHGSEPDGLSLPAKVLLSEMNGAELILHCETDAGRVTAVAPRHAFPNNPEKVWLDCDMARAHVFDSQTGLRVEL